MSKFLSSVLKGIVTSEQLMRGREEMELRQQRAANEQQMFDLQKKEIEDRQARAQAEKDFAVDAMNIQGRIGKEGSADAGPPAPALSEPDALDLMAKSASRFGLSDRAFDLAAKAGIKRDQHRLMGAVLGGDLNPMFERLGSFGIKAEEGQDPQTGKPFISITRKDGSTKLMPFESRDHMLGSMASLLEGKYADFALNMAKSNMSQDTALQRMYMDSAYKFGNLNRQIAETNARIDGTYNGGRGTGSGSKKSKSGGAGGDDAPPLYGDGIKDREDIDKMLKARIPDDAQITLDNEKATEPVTAFEFRNRIADHIENLAIGSGGQRTAGELLPIAQEMARRDFIAKQAGVQPPDSVFTRHPEYEPKTQTWRLKLVTPEGDSFYYGRPGIDPSRFKLSPEKLAEAHLQKANHEYGLLLELAKPENRMLLAQQIQKQFGGKEENFRGALEMARARVQELQGEREAEAEKRRESSRAGARSAPPAARSNSAPGAEFSADELASAAQAGVKPTRSASELMSEAWDSTKQSVGRAVAGMNENVFHNTLKITRSRGQISHSDAANLAQAIESNPALKSELTPSELNAIQVRLRRRLP